MLLRFPWKNVLPVKAGRGGLAEGEAPRVQHRKIFKIDVSEDCIIDKKSGLRRNPLMPIFHGNLVTKLRWGK
jgi:hypothetical protein